MHMWFSFKIYMRTIFSVFELNNSHYVDNIAEVVDKMRYLDNNPVIAEKIIDFRRLYLSTHIVQVF